MENIYSLGEKYRQIDDAYENAKAILEMTYEQNGGEVTDQTEALEKEAKALETLRKEIADSILSAPDEFAAIVKNTEAYKKVVEAELDAIKKEQAKANAKYEAKIKRLAGKIEWFKTNIADAMKLAEINKIGGPKTPNKFTIWFAKSESIEADSEALLTPYVNKVQEFINTLPKWVKVKTDIDKSALKENLKDKTAKHPDGACLVTNESLQIR